MSRKLVPLGLLFLILAPDAALSLGLGDIRLNSYLNQPMNAEIALSLASRAELDTLRVELASGEAFSRYGLDRPAYLDDLRFQVRPTGVASAVVQVTSSRPIVEPFVTFLLEARWSGGRILREYTVLLDPPVFLPRPETAPVAAPVPAPAVERPRPAPEPAPVDRPTPVDRPVSLPVRGEFGNEFGPVRRNDTLWSIAQRVRPDASVTTNQVMVALFRANPGAFDGNINRLRAGAILRVPSRDQIAATQAGEANAEVRRQNEAWRASVPAAAAPAERRLELAPPSEAPRPAAPAADPAAAAGSRELLDAVQDLRGELAETRRLMEIKDAEIAALQARLAELESDGVALTPAPEAAEATAPADAEPKAEPVAQPVAEPAPASAPRVVAPTPPTPSLLDRVLGVLGSIWLWLVLALALVAGAVAVFLRKRKEEDDRSIEEDLAATGRWAALETPQSKAATEPAAAAAAGAAAARRAPREEPSSILVEEARREPTQRDAPPVPPVVPVAPAVVPPPPPTEPDEEEYRYPFEDTIAGEAGINLDQTDPLAEADFHMAYGLYDQAAEIIKKAIDREPDRYDLRRKLVDICFVWGNAREFLAQAKALHEMAGEAPSGDWAKISIMGRQICPGEPLFAGGEATPVDVELGGEPEEAQALDIAASGSWLDFDVGESEPPIEALGDTREQPGLDGGASRAEHTAELNLEDLGIDLDLGESGEHALQDLADFEPEMAPESALELEVPEDWKPELVDEIDEEADESHTGTLRLDTPPVIPGLPAEPEASEPSGGTMMMDVGKLKRGIDDPTERSEGFELSEDEPTLAGIEGLEEEDDSDRTQLKTFGLPGDMPTVEVDTLEEDLDLDLDDLTQMLEANGGSAHGADDDATKLATSALEQPFESVGEGETREVPVEMNEVGTKLDLARAYVDMGDPEGARSILEEVLTEGDAAQQEEARQLLESLS